jgi:hypothetical protein
VPRAIRLAFADSMKKAQVAWRKQALPNQTKGRQNGHDYDHVLPKKEWELNLWSGIRSGGPQPLPPYLIANEIQRHTGSHNLCSSWIVCANLYFPFRSPDGKELLASFFRATLSGNIRSVEEIELEYQDTRVPPSALGETDGHRGSGQTSPDVAFQVRTESGSGVVLVECKFVEHSFYACSGRRKKDKDGRTPNPNPSRCLNYSEVLAAPSTQCHLAESWGRRYWEFLGPIASADTASRLASCPAAFAGYQLMRQHALAEAIAASDGFPLVCSAVAYDARNTGLMRSMAHSTELKDISKDWAPLFGGRARFKVFTHQSWVKWVGDHDSAGKWADWLGYVRGRYGL